MKFQVFTFNPFQENTYVVWDEASGECAVIDPGNYNHTENLILKNFIEANQLQPKYIWGTHAHIDHVFGNWYLRQEWNLPYYLHKADMAMLERSQDMAALWQLQYTPGPEPDIYLEHGMLLNLGTLEFEVRYVPGHAPGHVVFIHHASGVVFGGDTLFSGSIGRTDLPGGNHDLLLNSIRDQLFTLPDEYTVYSGHGPATTIGAEKTGNPFF